MLKFLVPKVLKARNNTLRSYCNLMLGILYTFWYFKIIFNRIGKIAEQTDVPFDREHLEEIYMMIDDASFRKISRRAKVDVFDDEPSACEQPEQVRHILPKKKKAGLLTALAAFATGSALAGRGKKKRDGHCDGDCTNCPPHYGYRYGRWYYGKGHQYGCEFGGNQGGGHL